MQLRKYSSKLIRLTVKVEVSVSTNEAKKSSKHIEFQLPLILLRTRKGLTLLDWLGRWKYNKILGWILLYMMPVAATIGLYIILSTVGIYLSNALARTFVRSYSPLANILIPGLNPYLPFVYGWIALIVGLVAHEGAHGILARSLKLTVKSTGLVFFLFVPIGAFAELDDKEIEKAPPRDAGRVLAAGPGANIIAGLVALAALLLLVSTMTPVANGTGIFAVVQDYPAYQAGIRPGDIIVRVDGQTATLLNVSKALSRLEPGDIIHFVVLHPEGGGAYSTNNYTIQLAANPANKSLPYVGITSVDIAGVLHDYKQLGFYSPLVYLVWPTMTAGQQRIPFSDALSRFYTSPIGPSLQPLANMFFWIWFVNFNLAIFNALPIYPLDGGHLFKLMVRRAAGGRLSSKNVSRFTYGVTLVVISLVLSMIVLPYLG